MSKWTVGEGLYMFRPVAEGINPKMQKCVSILAFGFNELSCLNGFLVGCLKVGLWLTQA